YASTLVLAVPVIIGRFFIVQSPLWLMFRGRVEEAEAATERLLLRDPRYPKEVVLHRAQARDTRHADQREKAPWSALFHGTNLDRTILASVPWFLQDLGTYGIGIFTPTILATIIGASIAHPRNVAELIQSDILATKGAAFIDMLLIVVATSLVGALVTWRYAIETKGISLEKIEEKRVAPKHNK